jgi:molecular chaperone HscB
MHYFEFYGLPISFRPDQHLVKQQFYALSKKYHPDFYINQSPEKQEEALELSTVNNKAFQVLKDPQRLLAYVLELKGLISEGENYSLPQSFLMEMMDVNESIMDLQLAPDAEKLASIKQEIADIETALNAELSRYTSHFEAQGEAEQAESLAKIKDIYYRGKYINRLKESLAKL